MSPVEAKQSADVRKLIEEHRAPLERELGARLEFTERADQDGPKWLIGPFRCNHDIAVFKSAAAEGPEIFLDRDQKILISDGQTPEEVTETYSYLRSLSRFAGGVWKIEDCRTIDAAADLLFQEVRTSFAGFSLGDLDWERISNGHMPRVRQAADAVAAMQEWLAELGDAHTWVRPTPALGSFPYDFCLDQGALRFYRILESSEAWRRGVRPGDELIFGGLDDWWRRTSATPHAKPFVVGLRALATPVGHSRSFEVKSRDAGLVEWQETALQDRWNPNVSWKRLPSGNGLLRVQAWMLGKNVDEEVDRAFEELRECPVLIVDLRANPGGNLLLAQSFRDRFLRESRVLGWIRTTLPDGRLGGREPIHGEPAPLGKRWRNRAVFLTDPLTYSASEDTLLGLQGQEHVRVIGQRSGGGSGRARMIRLLPGWRLTISTALTYDVRGHCIEGQGIPVDKDFPLSWEPETLVNAADRLKW